LPEIEILVTAGATQAIFTTIQALVKANDEVIILDPSYDCYEAPILLCNAIPVRISLNDDYTTNWGIIENACSTTTAMIIISAQSHRKDADNLILKLWNPCYKISKNYCPL
jgi:methionine aminotransferase